MEASDFEDIYVWPTGLGRTDALAIHLRETGIIYAQRALEQYSSSDSIQLLDAAVAIGSSVELIAKAMLADVAPVLLLEKADDVRSTLLFAGARHPRGDRMDSLLVKSVSASQATKRLKSLGLIHTWSDADDAVFGVRNAASHMGLVSAETLQDAIVIMVRFCNHAREYFKWDEESWWGAENMDLAARLLADAEERLSLLVSAKFSAARQVLARRRHEIPLAMQDAIFSSLADARPSISMELIGRLSCPICTSQGWAVGFPRMRVAGERDELTVAGEDDMEMEGFQCHVCGLLLDGWEEVAEGGLTGHLRLDSRDSS